jgi:ATP-dependent helicase/nuclease subunit B
VDVEPEGRSLQLAERFLAYRALTTPSERLALTRSASDGEGRPATASPYWQHVQGLLGLVPRKLRRESAQEPSCIGTPRQLAGVLMDWAREGGSPSGAAAALYQFLAEHDEMDGPLGVVRRLSWRALSYANRAVLKPETARRLHGEELSTSVSRLEKFARCPFSHYAAHVLKLQASQDAEDVSARDMGTMYHGVLEHLVRHCISQKLSFVDAASITPEKIQELTREIGAKLRGQIMLSNARNQYLLKRIETVLQGVVTSQQAVLRRGKLAPFRTELRFGENADLPPLALETPAGRRVRIYGQIDRVDYHEGSGYAAVIDYKHGGSELKLDQVTYGLSLQLLVYLLVLQRNGASLLASPPRPAAALYVKLLRGIQSIKHPSEGGNPGEPAFDLRVKPRGVIAADALSFIDADYCADPQRKGFSDAYSVAMSPAGALSKHSGNDLVKPGDLDLLIAEVERQVVRLADEVMAGVIEVRPYKMGTATPCPYCEFKPFCRFDPSQGDYRLLAPRRKWDVLAGLRGQPAPEHGEEE